MNILIMARDLILAQIQQKNIAADALDTWLKQVHDTLLALWQREQSPHAEPIDWHRSIAHSSITCLECGDAFRQIQPRHLKRHGLTMRTYRERYGIPSDVSLSSRATTLRRRRAIAKRRPWELSPQYGKRAGSK
jgi:predicted transcriptional regulator